MLDSPCDGPHPAAEHSRPVSTTPGWGALPLCLFVGPNMGTAHMELPDATWLRRLDTERRLGNISGDRERVLRVLWTEIEMGNPMPSEAALADLAGVKRSTVQRAKQAARALGLLEWDRVRHYVGNLRRDKPCSYRTQMPAAPAVCRKHQRDARAGSIKEASGPTRSVRQQLAALLPVTAAMQALIAARQADISRNPPPAFRP